MTGDGSFGRRRARTRTTAAVLALLLAGAFAPYALGSSSSQLDQAKAQLQALTERIRSEAATLDGLRAQAAEAGARYARADRELGLLLHARMRIQDRIAAVQVAYRDTQIRLHDAAVESFMDNPGGVPGAQTLDLILGAGSIGELQDRLAFGDAVADAQSQIASELLVAQTRLERHAHGVDALMAARRAMLRELATARQQRAQALTAELAAWDRLDATRSRLVHLIATLQKELQGQSVAAVASAFQGSAHVSYGDWADLFLRIFGAPTCRNNQVLVVSWQVQEFTQAAWNPLATTHGMDGSTDFNSVGVQNYTSLQQGLQATKETIQHGWDVYGYGAIIDSLKACSDPIATAHAIAASSWCPGCLDGMYVVGVVPKVEADFDTYSAL
ncbi:MAG TPA: hypothetical protein VK646_00490 [Actinomycetota bacterium]|nr:hypothetical protein [Actinomycetota bacterium]